MSTCNYVTVRICEFLVNTGCQIIVLDKNVDIDKSD